MKIDLNKLEKVVRKDDGKIQARCPACKEHGGDKRGEHLVIFPDGRFGCVVHQGDKPHNREILRLVGCSSIPSIPKLKIRRVIVPESQTIMVVGRLGRVNSTLKEESEKEISGAIPPITPVHVDSNPLGLENECPNCPGTAEPPAPVRPEGFSDEVWEFLSTPAPGQATAA